MFKHQLINKDLKERIKKLKESYGPKHWGIGIKKDEVLYAEVLKLKEQYPHLNNTACLYILETGYDIRCPNGNLKKWRDGEFIFCGRAGKCQCAAEQVAKSVAATKSQYTDEQRQAINDKRQATNMERYGVSNSGQTAVAREAHAKFYSDEDNVKSQIKKHRATMMERYGVDNPLKAKEIKDKQVATMMERYGVKNPRWLEDYKSKVEHTNMKRYGVPHPSSNEDVKRKLSETCKRIPDEDRDAFNDYVLEVNRHTRAAKKHFTLPEGYKWGAGNDDMQLDHIVPKTQGFKLGIPPEILGGRNNLQMMLGSDNKSKSDKPQPEDVVEALLEGKSIA